MLQRDKGWDIASFVVRTILTVIAAAILVLQANGYTIDFENLGIERAGLISIDVTPDSARVFIDRKPVRLLRGVYTSTYNPDVYSVEVQLNGYRPWHHLARVESGSVVRFDQIILFPERIAPIGERPVSDSEQQLALIDPRLQSLGTELWYRSDGSGQLVTRLSEPIRAATLLNDSHVLYQVADGIHAIDIDGLNDVLLVAQDNPQPMAMVLSNNDRVLSVVGSELTTQYQIQ